MKMDAQLSRDRRYRYWLTRTWDEETRPLVVIGLNPSTADEKTDDPTIRRCIGFARLWNYGGLVMLNLFAFRATDPTELRIAKDPIGPANDQTILDWTAHGEFTLAAWGVHGKLHNRGLAVRELLSHRMLHCLGLTQHGQPKHPLYLPAVSVPVVLP